MSLIIIIIIIIRTTKWCLPGPVTIILKLVRIGTLVCTKAYPTWRHRPLLEVRCPLRPTAVSVNYAVARSRVSVGSLSTVQRSTLRKGAIHKVTKCQPEMGMERE